MNVAFDKCDDLFPVDVYIHPDRRADISVVGVMHGASPEHYQHLGEYLVSRIEMGSFIHHEGIHAATFQELAAVDPELALRYRFFTGAHIYVEKIVKTLGRMYQYDAGYWPLIKGHYEQHDVSVLDLVVDLPAEIPRMDFRQMREYYLEVMAMTSAERAEEIAWLDAEKEYLPDDSDEEDYPSIWGKEGNPFILERRDKYAAEQACRYARCHPDTPLTLVWGKGHLAGIGAFLHDIDGYIKLA